MSEEMTTVSVQIMDKEYQVACPEEEVDELSASARHLDKQMSDIRARGKVLGADRIAVMAALNITHEYLQNADKAAGNGAAAEKVAELTDRVSQALTDQKQLNL